MAEGRSRNLAIKGKDILHFYESTCKCEKNLS